MTTWARNNNIRIAASVTAGLTALLLTFCLGVFVGVSAIGRLPRAPFTIVGLLGAYFGLHGHGAIGTVTSIEGSTLVIMDRLNQQHTIQVRGTTTIEDTLRRRITLKAIHIGDRIAVIGSPADGAINAVFVRLLNRGPATRLWRSAVGL
jgi:hypothetical protein